MSHFAFVCPPFLGHVNPMKALARELLRRGHRATFIGLREMAALLRDPAIGFEPVGAVTHGPGTLSRLERHMAGTSGLFGLPAILRDVAAMTDMLCRDGQGALRRIGADAVVADQAEAAGGLLAAGLGLPVVSVANALPLDREPSIPPPYTSWHYDPSAWGCERNKGGYRVADLMMRGHSEVIAHHAARWHLGPRRHVADCVSPLAEISQTVAPFDFPRAALPATFHHLGPLRDPVFAPFECPPEDGRPLVFASLGTLQGARLPIFRRIAAAAATEGMRLLIAHGGRLHAAEIASLPGRPVAHAFVPQDVVLRRASLAVVNGGLNTVMDAMARGVPAVAIPIAFEQGAIAARLVRAGAGLSLSRRWLTTASLGRAMRRLLDEPGFAQGAGRLRDAVAQAGGVRRAADIVEQVARTGRPVTAVDRPDLPRLRAA